MEAVNFLQKEIESLRYELSEVIPLEIQAAVDLGDLKENTEYSSALERQQFVAIRLEQLTHRLDAYKKIDVSKLPKDAINIGSIVKLRNLTTNKIEYVKVVLSDISVTNEYEEITINSPMGIALKNKKIKEEVIVKLPFGISKYKILQITTIHDL